MGRPGFKEWVDRQTDPEWELMPLTHITKGVNAEAIMRSGAIELGEPTSLGGPFAYLFYGRPAYRANGDAIVKMEAACPYCFIFDKDLIRSAEVIFAFDTGAFASRMYNHVLVEEFKAQDFSLDLNLDRPNKLIKAVFGSQKAYFDGDRSAMVEPEQGAEAWELEARAYLFLLASPGRNEPDDRVCSMEVAFSEPVFLSNHLRAVVAPHTHWATDKRSPWLEQLSSLGVEIVPYDFVPGRHPEHYQTLVEIAVKGLYNSWNLL